VDWTSSEHIHSTEFNAAPFLFRSIWFAGFVDDTVADLLLRYWMARCMTNVRMQRYDVSSIVHLRLVELGAKQSSSASISSSRQEVVYGHHF